jgi:putative ATP-dependent endonuclease of the OLD family
VHLLPVRRGGDDLRRAALLGGGGAVHAQLLAAATRDARAAFGEEAKGQLEQALKIVLDTAKHLGIPVGDEVKAMLDAHSASFSTGTISLHDEGGVPLRGLGLGSTRLLIAGLQRCAAEQASIILIDELEHGLEPHRIIRLLDALGAKEKSPPLQVFMTTHSPVAVRELSGDQLFVVRRSGARHEARHVGSTDEIQGAIRRYPEVLLAASVVVCEGASEVGLLRGLDQYRDSQGQPSIMALGVALVDGTGSPLFGRAQAFRSLGYRTAVLRDTDVHPTPDLETAFQASGGIVIAWRDGRALEDELFLSLSDAAIHELLAYAVELKEEPLINEHIKSASDNALDLAEIQVAALMDGFSREHRGLLAKAAKSGKGWFKTVSAMEAVARDIVGPDLLNADAGFREIIDTIFEWTADAGQ